MDFEEKARLDYFKHEIDLTGLTIIKDGDTAGELLDYLRPYAKTSRPYGAISLKDYCIFYRADTEEKQANLNKCLQLTKERTQNQITELETDIAKINELLEGGK